jgi:hypothetical protein
VVASDVPQTHVAASREALSAEPKIPMDTNPYEPGPPDVLFAFCPSGAPLVPDSVLLARRPYRPYRAALARGTLAPTSRCAAVHRSGNNSWVLAVPPSMCVRTLSVYIPTTRSILRALATSDIKLAFRTLARRDPMNNQFLHPTA